MKAENNKTKRRLAFHWGIAAAATIVLAVVVGWAGSWSTGPSYGGRYGEAWLRDVFAPNGAGTSQTSAIAAFNQMGTNGIAFLVESFTPFRPELMRALNDDYLGVRLFIADSSRIAKLLGPDHVLSSLTPFLASSSPGLRKAAQEVLLRAGFTNLVANQTNVP